MTRVQAHEIRPDRRAELKRSLLAGGSGKGGKNQGARGGGGLAKKAYVRAEATPFNRASSRQAGTRE